MEIRVINRLFNKMRAIKPAQRKMTDDEWENLYKVWAEYLTKKNITLEMIKTGLDKSVDDPNPFFPSIGQFIEWCRHIPECENIEKSHRHALKRLGGFEGWAHPVIYHAAVYEVGSHKMKRMTERDIATEWRKALERAKDKYFAGELPELPKALPEPERRIVSGEEMREGLERLKRKIGV